MSPPKVVCVVGTRPDAIKSAPVVRALRRFAREADTLLLSTGQHREMLDQALGAFGLKPDADLGIMRHGQTLAEVTTRALEGIDQYLGEVRPKLVLAQGDTTTTFVAGLAAFYRGVPFGHIEAGLRTDTILNPFPEEFNRRAVGLFAAQHYAPTSWAAQNLMRAGVKPNSVFVTGNTGIDAVRMMADCSRKQWFADHHGPIVLLTTHRRENWGAPQEAICRAARRLLHATPDALLVLPLHRNPQVRLTISSILGDEPRARLIEPPDYGEFVKLMERSALILTDSGGVQEEAPAFGIPVLVLRETTERPEGVDAGTAKLVGTDEDRIFEEAALLLRDKAAYAAMAKSVSPYGDGRAAERIRYLALGLLGIESPPEELWT